MVLERQRVRDDLSHVYMHHFGARMLTARRPGCITPADTPLEGLAHFKFDVLAT
jgi:hypothetical protein